MKHQNIIEKPICKICSNISLKYLGSKKGQWIANDFHIWQCNNCFYSFVQNYLSNYSEIYSENYYLGKGADPLADYIFELRNLKSTIREYEWRGILTAVSSLITINKNTNWLDFGCGNGGLVTFVQDKTSANAMGFEEGWIKKLNKNRIKILDYQDLARRKGSFDVVTAIEVLEHTPNPLDVLKQIADLLKPGGLFFYTTGNAKPYRNNLLNWRYVVP